MSNDTLVTLLLIVVILVLADVLLTGGVMMMTGATVMGAVVTHPLALIALIVLIGLLVTRIL